MKKSLLKILIFISALTFSISAWGISKTKLTVNIAGNGQIKVNTSSSQPSSWSSTSVTKDQSHGFFDVNVMDTYYIWVNGLDGYTCSGISGDGLTATWNAAGYYTVSFKGSTGTTEKTVTATFVTKFYSKAVAHAVPTVGKVWVGVGLDAVGDGKTSRGWYEPGTAYTYDWTYVEATTAPTYKYHYYKEDPDGYAFDGWYKNAACNSLKTKDTEILEDVTATRTEKTDLEYWAHWVPVTVNSVSPATSSVTFTEPGTKDVTLTFNVSNADAKADFNEPVISNTADWSLKSWNYSNNTVTVVVSMTVTGNVTTKGSHNTTVTLSSKGDSSDKSKVATINAMVDMNPAYTCNIANSYYVDDAALNLNALWTSTSDGAKTYTVTSFTPSGINNAGATTPYITGSSLYLSQAGTVQLKLSQAASTSYNSGEDTKTLVISKRDNTISISGFDDEPQHKIAIESYDNELVLTSNNTDYTNWPIQNEQITGDYTMASFGRQDGTQDKWVVYTDRTPGLVEWRLWQEETYKYKGAETTFSVNVVKNTNCSCNLLEMSWTDDLWNNPPTVSTVGSNNDGLIDFGDIGEYLYFSLRKNGVNGDDMNYSLFTDGAWGGNVHKWAESMTSYTPFVIDMSDKDHHTTKVQFYKGHTSEYWIGGDTDDPFINNISVTRKRWMKYLAKETDKSQIASLPYLPKQERVLGDAATSYTFYVDFSTCSEWVKVASLDDHVTFDNDMTKKVVSTDPTANNTRGYDGIVPLTIKYYSENVEKKDVKIIFYTEFDNDTLIVPVETVGYIFKGTTDTVWTKGENWNVGKVPNEIHDVIIESPAVIATEVIVNSITITTGSVTILPTGGLTVGKGGITGANTTNLYLRAGKTDEVKGQTGYLRVDPATDLDMPSATIELYSTAYYDMKATDHNETGEWQFVGYPLRDGASAKTVFSKSFLYNWNDSTAQWENNRTSCILQPFEGYATSQYRNADGWLITFAGKLVQNVDKVINLSYNEGSEFTHNMVANSYSAPIDITKFEDSDFEGIQAAVYIFNTGSRADIKNLSEAKSGSSNTPGQYLSIPIGSAAAMKGAFETPTVIAPMQGFCVHATEAGAKLRLDYEKLVYNATNKNTPLHVVAREQEQVGSLCVSLYAEGVADNLYLLESEEYEAAYENGYDAKKMESGEANIFAIEGTDHLAVDATNNIVGTRIGVRTGDTTAYVMTFTHLNGQYLALLDNETNEITEINEGTEYTFFAVPNSMITERFQIVASANAPAVTTGVNNTNEGETVQKFIQNGQLFILKKGVLYNAMGAVVR